MVFAFVDCLYFYSTHCGLLTFSSCCCSLSLNCLRDSSCSDCVVSVLFENGCEWLWMVEVVVVQTLLFWMVRIEFGVMIVLVVGVQLLCVVFFFFYLLFICFFINVTFCPWFCGWFWWFHAGIYAQFVSKRRGYGPSEAESCAAGWTQQRSVSDNEHNSARGRSSLVAVLTRGLVKRASPVAMARRLRGWILIVLWLLLQFNAVDCRHILPAMDTLDKVWPRSGVSQRILREAAKYDYTLHCLYIR